MKTTNAFILAVLLIALTLPLLGQQNHRGKTRQNTKKHDISNILGKPTVDATVEGLHMKVWIMTQKKHKTVMKKHMAHHNAKVMDGSSKEMGKDSLGMMHNGMQIDKATMDAMMAGTHHIMLDVTDSATGKEVTDATARVLIVFPSKKASSIDLKPMMTDFGAGLTLPEKGEYHFTVVVKAQGAPISKEFQYHVR